MKRTISVDSRLSAVKTVARICFVIACVAFAGGVPALADAPKEFAELHTKSAVFKNVRVISKNPSSITVRHSGGIAQIPFTDLPPELQAEFGYAPDEMAAFEAQLQQQAKEAAARAAHEAAQRATSQIVQGEADRIDRISKSFATEPAITAVDMRPKLRELELYVKDQGHSPSCAVFAVVSALELQSYEVTGRAEKLSESYLVWATNQIAGSRAPVTLDSEGTSVISDAGFSLIEVFQALGRFGIPTEETVHHFLGDQSLGAVDLPKDLVAEARRRSGVVAYAVPGRNQAEVARNIVHVLNNGLPVILALRWPHQNATQGGLLSTQEPIPRYAHAVTIVGYSSETGKPEDLRFIFKNSWGPKWGATGYGFADMGYMSKNLIGAAFIDLIPMRKPQQN